MYERFDYTASALTVDGTGTYIFPEMMESAELPF